MFGYFSAPGAAISNPASRTAGVRVVRITLVTSANTIPTPAPYRVQTDVYLRNGK